MTRDELMEQLVDLESFDKMPGSEKGDFLGNELLTILTWMADRPRPQPDAWESFYLVAAIGQLAAQNVKAAFSCSRKIFDAVADRHALIGMPPANIAQLERALATVRLANLAARESTDAAVFRNKRFPAAA